MRAVLALGVLAGIMGATSVAHAHWWYTAKHDPVTLRGCCGNSDCHELAIEPGVLTPEPDGFRIRLTAEQAQRINPGRLEPLDVLVPWSRVQPSEDGNYHMCLPRFNGVTPGDFYCFFMPNAS